MHRVYRRKFVLSTAAFISATLLISSPIAAHASGTETAAKARQGKLIPSDRAAVQKAHTSKFIADIAPDKTPLPFPAPDAPPARPVSAGTSPSGNTEPRLLRELQANEGAGAAGVGHLKVIAGLLLILLVSYGAFRRFVPQS